MCLSKLMAVWWANTFSSKKIVNKKLEMFQSATIVKGYSLTQSDQEIRILREDICEEKHWESVDLHMDI